MFGNIIMYFSLLLVGILVGRNEKVEKMLETKLGIIQSLCLMLLLFIMGVKIGMDDKVLSSFGKLGFKAVIITVFTVSFSIIFLRLGRGLIEGKKEKTVKEAAKVDA